LLQEQPTLVEQAQKCHLLGYGKDIERTQGQGNIDILFGNYLEIVSAEREERQNGNGCVRNSCVSSAPICTWIFLAFP
jgi:hypothetical protein